jgi:tetratricopeptide (TPR) repeat protein
MFAVTFYSYKGGVGRTSALVNTAFRLAEKGKRVFILDFDLEAPGVDSYRQISDGTPRQGILEYVSEYKTGGRVPPLVDYAFEVEIASTSPGRIFVMPAGRRDRNYQIQLAGLDWKYFYRHSRGFLFVENLKAAIEKDYSPDYVLVDSRTGLTDVFSICTLQLPDLVVLLFSLNNQNVSGTARVYQAIRSNQIGRDIQTILVATPIPDAPDSVDLLKRRLDCVRKTVHAEPKLFLSFDPFMAFEERILSTKDIPSGLSRGYEALTTQIISANKNDVLTMVEEARNLREQGNLELSELRYQEVVESNPTSATALIEYGVFLRIRGKPGAALEYFKKAHQLKPEDATILSKLSTTSLACSQVDNARGYLRKFLALSTSREEIFEVAMSFERFGYLDESIEAFERANEVKEDWHSYLGIGNIYMRKRNPAKALPYYQKGRELQPASLELVYNYAYALHLLGNPTATEYFKRSIELYEQRNLDSNRPSEKANIFQAVSHAYIGVGETQKARHSLEESLKIAKQLPQGHEVFSSISYMQVPLKEFAEETMELLKKLPETGARP